MSELGFESDPFGEHADAAEVEDKHQDVGNDMTDDEIRKLCTTDFAAQTNELLAKAKRQFLQKVKADVLEYISNVNTSMSQSRSHVKSEPAKVVTEEEEHHDNSLGMIGGATPVVSDAVVSGSGDIPSLGHISDAHESGLDPADQRGGQVSPADSPRPGGDESIDFSGSLEYDPFD